MLQKCCTCLTAHNFRHSRRPCLLICVYDLLEQSERLSATSLSTLAALGGHPGNATTSTVGRRGMSPSSCTWRFSQMLGTPRTARPTRRHTGVLRTHNHLCHRPATSSLERRAVQSATTRQPSTRIRASACSANTGEGHQCGMSFGRRPDRKGDADKAAKLRRTHGAPPVHEAPGTLRRPCLAPNAVPPHITSWPPMDRTCPPLLDHTRPRPHSLFWTLWRTETTY